MTKRKDTALAHPVDPNKWARIREAERVSYGGAVATPQRMDWRGGERQGGYRYVDGWNTYRADSAAMWARRQVHHREVHQGPVERHRPAKRGCHWVGFGVTYTVN
jgi:hypothetical protein